MHRLETPSSTPPHKTGLTFSPTPHTHCLFWGHTHTHLVLHENFLLREDFGTGHTCHTHTGDTHTHTHGFTHCTHFGGWLEVSASQTHTLFPTTIQHFSLGFPFPTTGFPSFWQFGTLPGTSFFSFLVAGVGQELFSPPPHPTQLPHPTSFWFRFDFPTLCRHLLSLSL